MKGEVMQIYLYNENCVRQGRVAGVLESDDEISDDDLHDIPAGDCHRRWGTADKLITEAHESLATRYDNRPGGAADAFRWKCDRAVLEYLED
jgi:hypothetical protein